VPFAKNNYNGQVKEDEIRRACSKNGEKRKHIIYWWENLKDRGVGGWMN
jgi:hypothetical protein